MFVRSRWPLYLTHGGALALSVTAVLVPEPATGTWPRGFPLTAVRRPATQPAVGARPGIPPGGRARPVGLLRRRDQFPALGADPYAVGLDLLEPAESGRLYPFQVRLVQPLLNRRGKPGLVLHLVNDGTFPAGEQSPAVATPAG